MAETILIRLQLDTRSIQVVEERLKKFKTRVEARLNLKIKINQAALTATLKAAEKKLDAFRKRAQDRLVIKARIQVDSAALAGLQTALASINNFTRKIAASTTAASKGFTQFSTVVNQANKAIRDLNRARIAGGAGGAFAETTKSAGLLNRALGITRQSFFGFVAAAAIGQRVLRSVVETFTEFETKLVRVGRLVGKSGDQLRDLGEELTNVASSLGIATNEVLDLAEAAARLGVAQDNLVQFVKQAQKVAIALQLTGQEAAEAFKSFTLLFKIDIANITKIGDAFNAVADASAVSAASLVRFVQFLGPVANQFNILGTEGIGAMTALGAVLAELGVSAQVTGTGLQRILAQITDRSREAARVAGVSFEEFSKLLKTDMLGALDLVLKGFNALDAQGKITAQTLLGLNNIRVGRVLNLLAANTERVAQKQLIANQAFRDGVSVEAEVQRQLATLQSQFQQTANEIGRVIRDAFEPFGKIVKDVLFQVREWIKENPEFAKQIATLAIEFGALVAVLGTVATAAFIFIEVFGSALGVITAFVGSVGRLLLWLARLVPAFGAASRAILFFSVASTRAAKIAIANLIAAITGAGVGGVSLIGALGKVRIAFLAASKAALIFLASAAKIIAVVGILVAGLVAIIDLASELAYALGLIQKPTEFLNTGWKKLGETFGFVEKQTEKTRNRLREIREEAKKSAEETGALTNAVNVLNQEFKTIADATERVSTGLKDFTEVSRESINNLLTQFSRTDVKLQELIDQEGLTEGIARTLRQGAVGVRQAFDQFIQEALTSREGKVGEEEAIARVQRVVDRINFIVGKDAPQFKIEVDKANFDRVRGQVNEFIKALAFEAVSDDSEKASKALAKFLQVFGAIDAATFGAEALKQFDKDLQSLRETFDITSEQALIFATKLQASRIPLAQVAGGLNPFMFQLERLFGSGQRGIEVFDEFINTLTKFRSSIVSIPDIDFVSDLKLDTANESLRTFVNLTAEQQTKLVEIVEQQKVRAKLQKGIADNAKEIARQEEKGLTALRKRLNFQKEILRFIQRNLELQGKDKSPELLKDEENTKTIILQLEEKIAKETKKTQDNDKERVRINRLLERINRRNESLLARQAETAKDMAAQIEAIHKREMAIVDTLRKQGATAQDIAKARVKATQNALLAETTFLTKQLEVFRREQQKAVRDLDKLQKSGEAFLRRQLRLLDPNKQINALEDLFDEFQKEALKGGFVGLERVALTRFQKRFQQVAAEQKKEDQTQLQDLFKKRIEVQERLQELGFEDEKARLDSLNQNRERQLLREKGLRGQALELELQKRMFEIEQEDRVRNRNFESATKELEETETKITDIQNRTFNNQGKVQALYKSASAELQKAFAIGDARVKEMERRAKNASNGIITASRELADAARKLEEAAKLAFFRRIFKEEFDQQKATNEARLDAANATIKTFTSLQQLLDVEFREKLSEFARTFEDFGTEFLTSGKKLVAINASLGETEQLIRQLKLKETSGEILTETEREALLNAEARQKSLKRDRKRLEETEKQNRETLRAFREKQGALAVEFAERLKEAFPEREDLQKAFAEGFDKILTSVERAGPTQEAFGFVSELTDKAIRDLINDINFRRTEIEKSTQKLSDKMDTFLEALPKTIEKTFEAFKKGNEKLNEAADKAEDIAKRALSKPEVVKPVEEAAKAPAEREKKAAKVSKEDTSEFTKAAAEEGKRVGDLVKKQQAKFTQFALDLVKAQAEVYDVDLTDEGAVAAARERLIQATAALNDFWSKQSSANKELFDRMFTLIENAGKAAFDAAEFPLDKAFAFRHAAITQMNELFRQFQETDSRLRHTVVSLAEKQQKEKEIEREIQEVMKEEIGAEGARGVEGATEAAEAAPIAEPAVEATDRVKTATETFTAKVQEGFTAVAGKLNEVQAVFDKAIVPFTEMLKGINLETLSEATTTLNDSVADANASLTGLLDVQSENIEAINGLAENVADFALQSAEKTREHTNYIAEKKENVATAQEILNSATL